ncbi:MAG: glycosyltransferase [Paracoccaceae bacterium]
MQTDPTAADFVSVIIPTYNRAHTLPRSIRSVLGQTHGNLELIVADDGSSDGTEALIAGWGDPRLVYRRAARNGGAGAARNLGLRHARGALIAFQDSDDEWLLDKLAHQLARLAEAGDDYGAIFGSKLIYGHDARFRYGEGLVAIAPEAGRTVPDGDITLETLRGNLISPQTLLMRAEAARKTGFYDERLPINEDWEFMIRLSRATRVRYDPRPVCVAYVQGDSISRRPRGRARSFLAVPRLHAGLFAPHPKIRARYLFSAGRTLQALGKPRSAVKALRRAVRLDPSRPRYWAGLGLALVKRAGI